MATWPFEPRPSGALGMPTWLRTEWASREPWLLRGQAVMFSEMKRCLPAAHHDDRFRESTEPAETAAEGIRCAPPARRGRVIIARCTASRAGSTHRTRPDYFEYGDHSKKRCRCSIVRSIRSPFFGVEPVARAPTDRFGAAEPDGIDGPAKRNQDRLRGDLRDGHNR